MNKPIVIGVDLATKPDVTVIRMPDNSMRIMEGNPTSDTIFKDMCKLASKYNPKRIPARHFKKGQQKTLRDLLTAGVSFTQVSEKRGEIASKRFDPSKVYKMPTSLDLSR